MHGCTHILRVDGEGNSIKSIFTNNVRLLFVNNNDCYFNEEVYWIVVLSICMVVSV